MKHTLFLAATAVMLAAVLLSSCRSQKQVTNITDVAADTTAVALTQIGH